MRIVVAYKWAADYQEATVDDRGAVDWNRARPVISPYDAVAMEVARRLANPVGGEVIGLSVGGDDAASSIATKSALARGLDRTVVVTDEALQGAGSTEVAETLTRAINHIGEVDLVLTGDSSIDIAAKMVSAVLAGWLGWPALTDVSEVTVELDRRIRLVRSVAGDSETLIVSGPAVVAMTSDALTPPVPGMKDILAAAKKPVEHLGLSAICDGLESMPGTVRGRSRPNHAARKRIVIDTSDPVRAAAHMVGVLREAGVL